SQLLNQELGLDARYDLELRPWPLSVSITNLEIAASDGGSPFLLARRVVARPRIFSLLGGKIDFGEVEIEEPQLRAVVRDGKIQNLSYKLPETKETEEETELPLSSIALTNARIDVSIDDVSLRSNEIDIDLVLDRGPLEVAARAGRTEIDYRHRDPIEGLGTRIDEDVVCSLTLRARYEEDDILVRRLELEGAADLDPAEGTRPNCTLAEDDWRRVTVAVASTQARLENGKLESLEGRVGLRAPVPLVHRFIDIDPVTGWVDVQLDEVKFAEGDRLPTARGRVRADVLGIDAKAIAHDFDAEVATREDAVEVTNIHVRWAGAQASIGSAVIRPFDEGIPLDARDILVKGAQMYDLLDDINVHPNAHVKWLLARTTVEHFGGTLSPVNLAGPMKSETKDFAIYDRPATDPHKRRLMGVERGNLTGTFKVTPKGIVLSGYTVDTGKSRVHTTVGIMFNEDFELSVTEGSYVELAHIAPVADIPMQGKATVTAKGRGTFDHPAFEGDVSIDAFEIGGFPIGSVAHGKAYFKPLKLELKEARLTHGLSTVDVPQLSLDFADGDADLVMKGRGDTRAVGLRMADFFEMVRLEKDPRWQGIAGLMRGNAEVDFVLGGKRDRCGRGRLEVKTNMEMTAVELFGESFQSGSLDMRYLWDDIDAGDRGIEVDVSSGVLRSANGTVLVRGTIRHGAELSAELTATGVALDKISAFQKAFGPAKEDDPQQRVRPEADLSLVANLSGTLHRIQAEADIDISPMRIGPDVLPASRFHLSMTPSRPPDKPVRQTRCGNGVMPEVVTPAPENDKLEAVFALGGQLFGGQVRFADVEITQEKSPMLTGTLQLRKLDLGALANLMPGVAFSAAPPRGSLDADVHIEELPVKEPGLAEVRVFVHDLQLTQAGRQVHIGKVAEPLLLSGDALRIPRMPVEVRFPSGLKATVTAGGTISDLSQPAPRLALSMQLPPVDLSQLGVDIPQVERAAGTVRASIELEGTTENPKLEGWAKLEGGELRIEGFPVPLDEIEVDLRISPTEARIRKARARVGNTGFLSVSGRMPLRGLELAGGTATLVARDVKLPLADG
ncbi:MAG TPA: hypothetical protein VFB62_02795, partial [Polyangiaceae bacterium]|nr:hypothetical protein [Polyangiaceae bacterium]